VRAPRWFSASIVAALVACGGGAGGGNDENGRPSIDPPACAASANICA